MRKKTKKPRNFSWLIKNRLAGCSLPRNTKQLNWVFKRKIKSMITLTETALPKSWTKNLAYLHLPTKDFAPSDTKQIDIAVNFIHERLQQLERVMVHCAGGRGRTGTILACYLVKYQNYSADDAIEKVRRERPRSIQSKSQENAIEHYEKFVAKK